MRGFSTVIALVIVVNIVSISALPSYGSNQFRGYAYWNERCAMDYKDDWLGFWNNWNNGRKEYQRERVNPSSCPLGCDCTKQELDCRHFTGTDLSSRNMYTSKVNVIRNGQLPVDLEKIKLIDVGLTHIEGNVFHNLTNLEILELGKNKLKVMPDVSLNRKLETLILDNNEIEIIIANVTALPKSLKELVLLHNKIKFIPDRMFDLPNLQRVSLSHNELSRFPEFYNSKKLELVFVDYNKIKSISYTSLQAFFGNNSLLKHLNFSHNQITYIPPKALSNLIHLKILELHVNKISTIDAQVFYNIPELCHLDLRGNEIKVLTTLGYTPVFEDLPELKTLILTGQSTKTTTIMYNAFKNLPNLEHLWLDFNDLQHFPNPAFSQEEWPSIKDLHIENNKLRTFSSYSSTDFPPDMKVLWSSLKVKNKPFSKMKSLQTFMAHNNLFGEITEEDLWELNNLKELYLSSNSLTEESINPEAFRNMSLSKLHLDGMNGIGIQYVPAVVKLKSRLPLVTEIDLSGNKLTFLINGSFSSLETLTTLKLQNNLIVSAETGVFPENIVTIDMDSNKFDFRHPDIFANLPSLTSLSLRTNLITSLPEQALHGLEKLTNLNLGRNKIGRILKEAFKDLKRLSWLDVSNNELSYIEEGTFTAIDRSLNPSLNLNLGNNHLTLLPAQGDFNDLQITRLLVDNNRLTRIRSKTFANLKCSSYSDWNFGENDIVEIEEDSFVNITGLNTCKFNFGGARKNPLKNIASRAFNNVEAREISLNGLELTTLHPETFKNVKLTEDLDLQNNAIESIQVGAFDKVEARYLYLRNNKIKDISGKIFGSGSKVRVLDLRGNEIKSLHEDSFKDLRITEKLFLFNNKLVTFPGKALESLNPQELDLRYNYIPSLPPHSLDHLTNLQKLYMSNNNITKLEKYVFQRLTQLKYLYLENNAITDVAEGTFDNLDELYEINAENNKIKNIPTFKKLPELTKINLERNKLEMMGIMAFSNLPKLNDLRLSNNLLACGCNVFNSLVDVIQSLHNAATCHTPARVRDVTFPGTYKQASRRDFTCAPINLTASTPNDFHLRLDWETTTYLFPVEVKNGTNGTKVIDYDNSTNPNISYVITCHGPANQSIQGRITNRTWFVFEKKDGILAGSDYTCFVQTIEISVNGSKQVISRTSVNSHSVFQTTIEGKAPVTNTSTNTSNYYLDITYYDFSSSEPDFVSVKYKEIIGIPRYIASPYGSWLSHPNKAEFSDWFRSESTRNQHYQETLQLLITHEIDRNSNRIYRYFSSEFFPVDGRGFRAEGQRDCTSHTLRNFGFTAAARNTFNFTGQEVLTFAGGEELYVFVNKLLIVELFHDPSNNTTPCAVVELRNAQTKGGENIEWKTGFINGQICQNTKSSGQKVKLELIIGLPYRLDVFLAERFLCQSLFLFQASGISFIQPEQITNPVDYLVKVPESLHVGAVIQEFMIGDEFTKGDYRAVILSGNNQRRFAINSSTYKPPSFQEINVTNQTIMCANASNVTLPIPIVSSAVETFILPSGNTTAFVTLKNPLDYEATKDYDLLIELTDAKSGRRGNITIKIFVWDVNDNCPILPKISYNFSPVPPLVKTAFFIIKATDLDSGQNSEISYYPKRISEWNVVSRTPFHTQNYTEIVWVNKTIETTWTYRIYAVDNGVPRREDYILVNVTIDATCTSHATFVINGSTGEVFLRAPSLTVSEYPLNVSAPMCRRCRAGYYCVGDGTEKPCGTSSTQYSFGGANKCEKCPAGWLCKNGTALPCPPDTWVICNETFCPDNCNPCEPGTVCFNGNQTDCLPGTYSDGTGFPCKLCPPGSYNNISRATTCACCPAGYTSTYEKRSCQACHAREWAEEGNFPYCGICKSCVTLTQCRCLADPSPCFPGVLCRNLDYGVYKCGDCLDGYEGNGTQCVDIDECAGSSPCNSTCINLSPGYRCGACPAGHSGSAPSGIGLKNARMKRQTCEDIDECAEGLHLCDANAKCINTIGSYKCGTCNAGYIGNGYSGCTLGNLCDSGANYCHSNATCISQGSGRYTCVCKEGFAGDGKVCGYDDDMDGVPTKGLSCLNHHCKRDNCPFVPNEGQEDHDDDSDGDTCDPDDDNDNINDEDDNCQFTANPDQVDYDNDGVGNACDNCNTTANTYQEDINQDGQGDKCDSDMDGDGIPNNIDNCPKVNTTNQTDSDGDNVGDVCDNCPNSNNADQADDNQNGYGTVCDVVGSDRDGDSIYNAFDNCVDLPNAEQANKDGDSFGDACDEDIDNDNVPNNKDNCPFVDNVDQNHTQLIFDANGMEIGDSCNEDFDGDGVLDIEDSCPKVANIQRTSFTDHFVVSMDSRPPLSMWKISNKGRDVNELSNTSSPSMLIGNQHYGPVDFSGTMFVNTQEGLNYIGFVFGYQSNRKFYVVMWRHKNQNLHDNTYKAGIKGIQLKLVNSDSGPNTAVAQALWHSADTLNKVSLLWHDPLMQGWEHKTAYKFYLRYRPSVGKIRLFLSKGEVVLADSGDIYDTTITGGRLGLFIYGQDDVIWSRLQATCQDRENHALLFDGVKDSVSLPTVKQLQLTDSFTISAWIKMSTSYPTSSMPVVCAFDTTICLFIKNRKLHGGFGDHVILGNEIIESDDWHHAVIRYDAQRHELEIFLNGTTEGKLTDITPIQWITDSSVFLGKDRTLFFDGQIDDVSFWPIKQSDSEVKDYAKMAGLSWPKHKGLVRAHYTMDQKFGTTLLDESGNNLNGSLQGGPLWVQSSLDKVRFQLTYPNNRKKRSAEFLHTEL